ncbi:ribonuclease HII [Roseococcus sp. SYP-B2431]|uniref:ribonuclease HII n=1 Tax=Roseococcus sp. SYP-B2431 TaxID=2496640 RepID=UPI00103F54DD|nr:ribonuclease HII [Roseococcus sp. SYP-B2431]TCH97953.1 ribonuclease HII [Roseococcus sp. SYP-B2431]
MPDFSLEASLGGLVAGVDEAGRGPLAGPVMAAAVLFLRPCPRRLAKLLDDSKRLTEPQRLEAALALREAAGKGWLVMALGAASTAEIGRINILQASLLAMRRAVTRLAVAPEIVLVDGNRPPAMPCRVQCVIGGDGLSLSIAAASILAKTVRDAGMRKLCQRWPAYGFGQHFGYATARHRAALQEHGACPHHRRGFAPVEEAMQGVLLTA